MNRELIDLLSAYLAGWKTILDCAEWFTGVEWDNSATGPEDRALLGRLELLATEATEGLRPEAEFSEVAADIVAASKGSRYVIRPSPVGLTIAASSNDMTVRNFEFIVSLGVTSQSWNISPQLVPG